MGTVSVPFTAHTKHAGGGEVREVEMGGEGVEKKGVSNTSRSRSPVIMLAELPGSLKSIVKQPLSPGW